MKKLFLILSLFVICVVAKAQSPTVSMRYKPDGLHYDDTGAKLKYHASQITPYAATITLKPNSQVHSHQYRLDSLTGALTLKIDTINPKFGDDILVVMMSDSASAGHTVTLGTSIKGSSTTIAVAKNTNSWLYLVFNGLSWYEMYRITSR